MVAKIKPMVYAYVVRSDVMEKRIVVAGCRNYYNYEEANVFIEYCIKKNCPNDTVILLSGGCRGADALGERYAKENGLSVEYYPAEWEKYGKAAGPIRNQIMVDNCDYVVCFWDNKSKGTKSLINYTKKTGKPLFVKIIGE